MLLLLLKKRKIAKGWNEIKEKGCAQKNEPNKRATRIKRCPKRFKNSRRKMNN